MSLTTVERALVDLIGAAFPLNESTAPPPDLTGLDWSQLVRSASDHGLAPLAYAALKKCDLFNVAPKSAIETLRIDYLRASIANRLAFQELARLLDRFERENISAIVLKGGALALTLYDDIALRPMGDLDLLIHQSSLGRAREILIEEGYEDGYAALTGMAGRDAVRFSVAQSFQRMGKRPSQIDIHWHAFTTPYYFERIPVEWFWQRATEFSVGPARALAFSPGAQLLHLAAHCMLHGYRRRIWSYDIAQLIARRFDEIDWDEIVRAAARFGLSQLLSKALIEAREQWRVSVPASASERLQSAHTPLKGRMVSGAAEAVSGGPLDLINGFGLLGARKKLDYWKGIAFPSASYMQSRFQIRNQALLLPWYVWRVGRAVCLMARAGLLISREAIFSRLFRRAI